MTTTHTFNTESYQSPKVMIGDLSLTTIILQSSGNEGMGNGGFLDE